MIGRLYVEDGQPVMVLARFDHRGLGQRHRSPRNVLLHRLLDDTLVVRPFRGLRRHPSQMHRLRGWPAVSVDGVWVWADTLQPVDWKDNDRPCYTCGLLPVDKHDACIAHLPRVANACCGHGFPECENGDAYVQFHGDLATIRGEVALDWMRDQGHDPPTRPLLLR